MELAHLDQDSPFRQPDWRWQLAGHFLQQRRVPLYKVQADPLLKYCYHYRKLDSSPTYGPERAVAHLPGCREKPAKFKPLEYALLFYNDDGLAKVELESRILAREPFADIAKKLATTEEIVDLYEQVFFNVADRLEAPSYITHHAIGSDLHHGVSSRSFPAIWKLYGYWAGPVVLDALCHAYNNDMRPTTREGAAALLRADFDDQLTAKAAMYLRSVGYDPEQLEKVAALYLRITTLRESQGAADAQQHAFLQHVEKMLGQLTMRTAQAGQLTDGRVLDAVDSSPVSLRASELQAVSELGKIPESIQHLAAELAFPEAP